MSITFKTFATLVSEGKVAYSSESYWKGDAEEAGYKIKKLSGELMKGNQTWGAFNDKDEKVGEFTEEEEGRGGWLMENQVNEVFGMFRSAEKIKADREKLRADTAAKVTAHREAQAKKNGQGQGKDPDAEDEDDEDDKKKKVTSDTRSSSTRGTRSTQSAAGARHAESEWLNGMK